MSSLWIRWALTGCATLMIGAGCAHRRPAATTPEPPDEAAAEATRPLRRQMAETGRALRETRKTLSRLEERNRETREALEATRSEQQATTVELRLLAQSLEQANLRLAQHAEDLSQTQQRILALEASNKELARRAEQAKATLDQERASKRRAEELLALKENETTELVKALDAQNRALVDWANSQGPTPASVVTEARPAAVSDTARAIAIERVAQGNRLIDQGRTQEARPLFEQARDLDPTLVGPILGLAACAYAADELDEADALLTETIALDPFNTQAKGLTALAHWKRGRFRRAQSILSEALRDDPTNPQLHNYMGVILHSRKQFADAAESFRQAIRLKPDFAEAHYNLAVMLVVQRPAEYDQARKHYEQAVQLGSPQDERLRLLLYPQSGESNAEGETP